jgi:uncharacterized protein YPO0396
MNFEMPKSNNKIPKSVNKLEDLSKEQLAEIKKGQKEFDSILEKENEQLEALAANLRDKLKKIKESPKA